MNASTDTPSDDGDEDQGSAIAGTEQDPGTGDGQELRAKGVTANHEPDPDDPAAVAPWPPPGDEHLAEKETKARDEDDLPSPGVTANHEPDPDDPAAVAPWSPGEEPLADEG